MTLVFWGTYDLSKPRNQILRKGLREAGATLIECHFDVWQDQKDKSQIKGLLPKLRILLRLLVAYPVLVFRYLRLPRHDAVLLGYMAQLDVVVLRPFAKLRGVPVVWDVLMSLYVATVEDRNLLSPKSVPGRMLYAWEWLAFRCAERLVMSNVHSAAYLGDRFRLAPGLTTAVLIGADTAYFPRRRLRTKRRVSDRPVQVLFYGTFIPSHGVRTIVEAAWLLRDQPINWTLIGQGQEAARIDALLQQRRLPRVQRISWVPYSALAKQIHHADVCLGFFAPGERANHALANKICQILVTGTPLITRDSPAIRQLLHPDMPGIYLVPPNTPEALAEAVLAFAKQRDQLARQPLHLGLRALLRPESIGESMLNTIAQVLPQGRRR